MQVLVNKNVVALQMGFSLMWSMYIHYCQESGNHP